MEQQHKTAAREKPVRYERGAVVRALGWCGALITAMLMALAISVFVECIGIALAWWPSTHARTLLATERGYIEAIDQFPLTALSPQLIADQASQEFDGLWQSLWSPGQNGTYTTAGIHAVKLVLLRMAICLFVLPGFLLIAVGAFYDGLVARDIRKYTGGHESSYVFHKAKRWIAPSVLLTISLYLMLPYSIAPVFVFAPSMLLTGLMIYVATSRFKKFL